MVQRITQMRQRGEKGFTLIELLVVIIILGVLSAVVVFAVRGAGDKGQSAAGKIDVRTLRTAEEAYKAQKGTYGTEADLVSGGFLSEPSQRHDVILSGSGANATYNIVCAPGTTNCGGSDGAAPRGGVIRVAGGNGAAVSGDNFVNPAVTSGGGVHPNVEYMFNGLLRWSESNNVQPDLAESFTVSPDQKTYTFVMKDSDTGTGGYQPYTWHNGDPILSSDVKFTFEEALLKFHGRTSASVGPALGTTGVGGAAVTPPTAITTPDTQTVIFNFLYSYAPLLRQMNVTESPILPETVYGACRHDGGGPGTDNIDFGGGTPTTSPACGPNNPGSGDFPTPRPVGSGPFSFKSRNTTTGALVFVKFAGYHTAGLPLADEIQQIPTTDNANALIANSIDVGSPANNRILPIVSPQTSADITPANGYSLVQPPRGAGGGNCILTESFNLWPRAMTPATINAKAPNAPYEHPIFGDPTIVPAANGHPAMQRGALVRKALSMAVDRQALFNANQFGKGKLATSPYHSAVPGYTPTALAPLDVTTAGQWLTDAGWIDNGGATRVSDHTFGTVDPGEPLAFLLVAGTGGQTTYGQSIETQWQAAPIKADMTVSAQSNATISQSRFADRDYDMITVSYCNGDDPVIGVRRQYYAATSVGATAGSQISTTGFTNAAGYRSQTMDAAWDNAAQGGGNTAHATIQSEAAANNPYIWLDESLGSRAWRTSKCAGFNNNNTGLFVETAGCLP